MKSGDRPDRKRWKAATLYAALVGWLEWGRKGTKQRKARWGRVAHHRRARTRRVSRDRARRAMTKALQRTRRRRGQNRRTGKRG